MPKLTKILETVEFLFETYNERSGNADQKLKYKL